MIDVTVRVIRATKRANEVMDGFVIHINVYSYMH